MKKREQIPNQLGINVLHTLAKLLRAIGYGDRPYDYKINRLVGALTGSAMRDRHTFSIKTSIEDLISSWESIL